MATARVDQTATLLSDGRVLVVGGDAGGNDYFRGPLASAELYDPKTGAFTATGSLHDARDSATATLLLDGRVLVTGGVGKATYSGPCVNCTGVAAIASAELYDPQTGTFTRTGSMHQARNNQTATLLADGRVLIVGGQNGGAPLASAELYDPKTGKFSYTGSTGVVRDEHTATLLQDGRVLVTGGIVIPGSLDTATAELYDPKTGRFSPTGAMSVAREYHTATLLADGRVLIAGGADVASTLPSAELYDPGTGTFSPTGAMTDDFSCRAHCEPPGIRAGPDRGWRGLHGCSSLG
jgi:hypothetical protein